MLMDVVICCWGGWDGEKSVHDSKKGLKAELMFMPLYFCCCCWLAYSFLDSIPGFLLAVGVCFVYTLED